MLELILIFYKNFILKFLSLLILIKIILITHLIKAIISINHKRESYLFLIKNKKSNHFVMILIFILFIEIFFFEYNY